jgi:uncharacterized membrane protein
MQTVLDYVTLTIASIAGVIVVYAVIVGVVELVKEEWATLKSRGTRSPSFDRIRHDIGSHLLLGLEFLIAADIVRSVVNPTLEELAVLGGIVAIRTVLSYFLGREIDHRHTGK